MGLLQAAYRTYETQIARVGVANANEKEPLTPISHMVQNAQVEITISDDGRFESARAVDKEESKTILPATIESANRTGSCPHPLCDQLAYLSPHGGEKYAAYCQQLAQWAGSAFSHPKVRAVHGYVQSGTILSDLATAGLVPPETAASGKTEKIDKWFVRWRVIPAPEGGTAACWQDPTLFDSFIHYYEEQCRGQPRDLCMLSGEEDMLCATHPKGMVPLYGNAKLISSKDSAGFVYHGRFTQAEEAFNVGYIASQKAHNALRWVVVNHGVMMGGRTFLCWNPEGHAVELFPILGLPSGKATDFQSYRRELQKALGGYKQLLKPEADVVIAALDAATTGRLAVTYYNELTGSDFLTRVEDWYNTFCWKSAAFGVQSPSLWHIVTAAFGTQRGEFLEVDERVRGEHVQRMLHCLIDRQPIPQDILHALVVRASSPLAYTPKNRERILQTTCAVVRKVRNDRAKKEEWTLALDTSNRDRSYLFGRLLAVAEQAERSTYDREEAREPNAIRLQAVFAQRPLYAWRIIHEQLTPYFARMSPGLRAYFKNLIGEIADKLPPADDPTLNERLADTYVLGYSLQRAALLTKKDKTTTEGQDDEHSENEN